MNHLINNKLVLPIFLLTEVSATTTIAHADSDYYENKLVQLHEQAKLPDNYQSNQLPENEVFTVVKAFNFIESEIGEVNNGDREISFNSKPVYRRSGILRARLRKNTDSIKSRF